jgi:hypothetical protein
MFQRKPCGRCSTAFFAFERQRGQVLVAAEQPALVGPVLAQEDETKREDACRNWTHLRRGFDMGPLGWAALLAAGAIIVYSLARALGWMIDGFVTPRPD